MYVVLVGRRDQYILLWYVVQVIDWGVVLADLADALSVDVEYFDAAVHAPNV